MPEIAAVRGVLDLVCLAAGATAAEFVVQSEQSHEDERTTVGSGPIVSSTSPVRDVLVLHDAQDAELECASWVRSVAMAPVGSPHGEWGWVAIAHANIGAFGSATNQALQVAAGLLEDHLDRNLEIDRLDDLSNDLRNHQEELRHTRDELQVTNRQLVRLAATDSLTGLANRREIEDVLRVCLSGAPNNEAHTTPLNCTVALIDLDGFKSVNDTYGHNAGDNLLVAVGRRIRSQIRVFDVVGRWGGDEFIVIMPGPMSRTTAETKAEEIRDSLQEPFTFDGITVQIDASVGIALGTLRQDPIDLISMADTAMYVRKGQQSPKASSSSGVARLTPQTDK